MNTIWPAANVAVAAPTLAMSIAQIQAVPAATEPATLFDLTAVRSGLTCRIGMAPGPATPAIAMASPDGSTRAEAAITVAGGIATDARPHASIARTTSHRPTTCISLDPAAYSLSRRHDRA